MDILCVVPARGGSKGLKDKNIKLLYGKPLIAYSIEAALGSRLVNKIVVSTDDGKIAKVASRYRLQVIKRPKRYAIDSAPIELALRHAVRYLKRRGYMADIIVWLQANVPIRKKGQIDNVVQKLINSDADSSVTVYPVSQLPYWMKRMDERGILSAFIPGIKTYRRQDAEPLYLLDGAIVAIKTKVLMEAHHLRRAHVFLGNRTIGVIQENKKYSVEVDDKESFNLARFYLSEQENR